MGAEFWYAGLHLSSDFDIPELILCDEFSAANLRIQTQHVSHTFGGPWQHQWLSDNGVVLSVARFGGQYALGFDVGHTFFFDAKARVIACRAPSDPGARHQLLDQVLPRVLEHLGHLMIHASTVLTPNGVVMFVADTGIGKSTLAASFEAAGAELLSDDCARVILGHDDGVRCLPTYRSLRLWSDSGDAIMPDTPSEPMARGGDKRRVTLARTTVESPSEIAAICVLADDDGSSQEITFSPVPAARAVSLLIGQCFRLDPTDAEATKRTFERCASVVECVPVVELAYPRDYDRLPEVRDAVLRRAETGDWTSATRV